MNCRRCPVRPMKRPFFCLLTEDSLAEIFSDSVSPGFCVACGATDDGPVEPDACKYRCGECRQPAVYAIQELTIHGRLVLVDDPDETSHREAVEAATVQAVYREGARFRPLYGSEVLA